MATGTADGWMTMEVGLGGGGWQWSAYGPNGGERGNAATEVEAQAAAQRAHERLRRPRLTVVEGSDGG